MRLKLLATCIALAALSLSVVGAAAKADFTGMWVLDVGKSEGIWPGTQQTLTVSQTDDRIEIELKSKTPQGERTTKDAYTADGREVEFAPPGAVSKGKRTVRWAADGSAIEINELYDAQTPEGTDTMKAWRRWSLSADGSLLFIEQRAQTPNGLSLTKRVFVKQ
ncbi:MAG: hypothetical protein QOF61_3127 [Acidobacteriota bacterium]|jgi:hypothetical protein|nr:hypothetical protein [Acidobacteriota bacterium]